MTAALPINIDRLLRQRTIESERVEYKAGWNPMGILRTLGAFANDFHNLGGGYIVLGVEERDGRPVLPPKGIDPNAVDGIQKELLKLGNSAIQPPYHPLTAIHEIDGKTILVLYAPGGETRPYWTKANLSADSREWAYYIRRHSSTVRARGEDERELLGLAATVPFDDRYHRNASLDDLSLRLIQQHLQDVGSDLLTEVVELPMEGLGRRMNIVGGPDEALFPKNVGLLFFNDRPHEFFPATQIDLVWFPDGPGGDYFEEKEFRGPLAAILRDAVSYIERSFLKEAVIKHPDRPEADRFWNFPVAAIEEALGNAIYHRSYEMREPVEVRITPEELVVLSFPGADRSIRMADLQQGRAVSRRYRNRRIGEFLKELDLAEGRSTGVPKMLRAMRNNGSTPPIFETDDDRTWFLVRLPVHEEFSRAEEHGGEQDAGQDTSLEIAREVSSTVQVTDQDTDHVTDQDNPLEKNDNSASTPQVTDHVTDQVTDQVTDHVTDHVTDQVRQLVLALTGEMQRQQLQEVLGIRHRPHFRQQFIHPALKAGLIEMTFPDKPKSSKQRYRRTLAGEALAREIRDLQE